MPDSEKVLMWNGGTTNDTKEKAIKEWNKMIRESEDYLDKVDVDNQDNFNPVDRINKDMDKRSPISTGEPRNRYRRPEGDKVK